ncbi:MAG: bifunctional adenosylcobinamide kinase/adenosylcobinamide-phosphate guanylyltransferase [Firmicutes bacterium]|nr:bifunctional adenosylcobinamide kinase/adenosylcobinamide-phosphate guanylyltransferase [Bacillota bacterium]
MTMRGGGLFLITGGSASGKSLFAERLAARLSDERGCGVVYLATGWAEDREMHKRIEAHRRRRPLGWRTVEIGAGRDARMGTEVGVGPGGPVGIFEEAAARLGEAEDLVLMDSLGTLVARWMNGIDPSAGEFGGESGEDPDDGALGESAGRPRGKPAGESPGKSREESLGVFPGEALVQAVDLLVAAALEVPAGVIVVTDEVGWGLVPTYPSGRLFRDLLGTANQRVAEAAEEVYAVIAGIPVPLKAGGRALQWSARRPGGGQAKGPARRPER